MDANNAPDEIDEAVDAALEVTEQPPDEMVQATTSMRELAAIEEANSVRQINAAKEMEEQAEFDLEEPTIQAAAKGRDYLLAKMRAHQNKPKQVYNPPPMTERMATNISAEQEAGQRALAKHAAQAAPPRAVDRAKEGFTTPVYRPGDVVPDPKTVPVTGFQAGTKRYSADV